MRQHHVSWIYLIVLAVLLFAVPASAQVYHFDFQPANGPVESGFTPVAPTDAYSANKGWGFTQAPEGDKDASDATFKSFTKSLTVDEAIPTSVLSNKTRDSVRGKQPFTFQVDVEPGEYDVTVWLGDLSTALYQVRATVNDTQIDVDRMDINVLRGSLVLPDGAEKNIVFYGNAVPKTVRVKADNGSIVVTVGPGPETDAVEWTFTVDQCEKPANNGIKSTTLLDAYNFAALQALTIRPAADPPLVWKNNQLVRGAAPDTAEVDQALDAFNSGDMATAKSRFSALANNGLPAVAGDGLFWVAGHPATIKDEPTLLAQAGAHLETALPDNAGDWSAEDGALDHLLLHVHMAADAEFYRQALGYGKPSSSANMGRSNSLTEHWSEGHPYYWKGRILWFRNRGGLDPRRCTVSWEIAQQNAQELEPLWGQVNPYVHLYATDEWDNIGEPWTFVDWGKIIGDGPNWARTLVRSLNTTLDLSEWWIINRQIRDPNNPYGETPGSIGGGWTDDVELVGLFGLMGYVLEGGSDISRDGAILLVDGIWDSGTINTQKGYQQLYSDVEHSAEPTGDSLHLYPMLRYGDPEGLERIMKNAKTFQDTFLFTTGLGHTHFKANHMSANKIGISLKHWVDIPLDGRAVAPLPWLIWYSSHPAAEASLKAWIESWIADAERTDKGKPKGIFPNGVVTLTNAELEMEEEEIGFPGGSWHEKATQWGQMTEFPKHQHYLYNMAGMLYLRSNDPTFLKPFDAAVTHGLAYKAAGKPKLGTEPGANGESASVWAGGKVANTVAGTLLEVSRLKNIDDPDWKEYLATYASSWGAYVQDPTNPKTVHAISKVPDTLAASWPYRTTEGIMTDRIAVPGIGQEISYYLGANVKAVYYGMPVPSVTWANTTRLFAAAVSEASETSLKASLYLFADQGRTIEMRLWGLQVGGSYVLKAGPAVDKTDGLGQEAASIETELSFIVAERGETVAFNLPGRTAYSIRIEQTAPGTSTTPLLADLALAPRDVVYDAAKGTVTVTVHNVGGADAPASNIALYSGNGEESALADKAVKALAAPNDLVAKITQVSFDYSPAELPAQLTVHVDPNNELQEIFKGNNRTTVWIGGDVAVLPAPMMHGLKPNLAAPGNTIKVVGKYFQQGIVVLASETPSADLSVEFKSATELSLTVSVDAAEGVYLVSLQNPNGKKSNLLPLTVSATAPPPPDEEPEEDLGSPPDYTPFDDAGSIDPEQGGGSGEDSTVGIPPKADDGGGCGCRASSRGPTGHATLGLLLMLLLTVLRVWGYRRGVQSD